MYVKYLIIFIERNEKDMFSVRISANTFVYD